MKKIFSIISAIMSGVVLLFVLTLCFIKTNVKMDRNNPAFIYVFNKSTTATVANGYSKNNAEYEKVLKRLNKVSSVSIFTRLVNGADVNPKIEQDLNGTFSKWSTDIKQNNVVVELVYDREQDMIVYVGDDTRVVSYFCLSYVIPLTKDFSDIIVYYATTNSDDGKNQSYQECSPLVIKGKAGSMLKYVDTLIK